jgi:hypothetical protein
MAVVTNARTALNYYAVLQREDIDYMKDKLL